mmetsp:Transcript_33864/g.88701  ORF Transcript_33864/g.88701 Transcript_33864/m.88701 type:complete len:255 (+) Transcript_33864:809-1573(+)
MKSSRLRSISWSLRSADHRPFLPRADVPRSENTDSCGSDAPSICPGWLLSMPWCLAKTVIAAFKFSRAWMLSTSMPWNSSFCFSRIAMASARAFLSFSVLAFTSAMVAVSPPSFAVRLSMSAFSCSTFSLEASTALPFSHELLSHQHFSFSYSFSSSSASACRVFDMSFRRPTTRVTGVSRAAPRLPVPSSAAFQVWSSAPVLAKAAPLGDDAVAPRRPTTASRHPAKRAIIFLRCSNTTFRYGLRRRMVLART